MRALARVAKEVKIHLRQPERGKFFNNNSKTFKFDYILSDFYLCFIKFKVTKYKQKQTKRKTEKQTQKKRKTISCGFRVLLFILSSHW